ncbi:MAG: hypothetical protein RIF41_25280 [Polyangiaceae bacterium]
MRFSEELRFVAVATAALSLTACSSLTQADTYEVDKDSVIAARPQPPPPTPTPAADGSLPGAVAVPGNPRGNPLQIPGGAARVPGKKGG